MGEDVAAHRPVSKETQCRSKRDLLWSKRDRLGEDAAVHRPFKEKGTLDCRGYATEEKRRERYQIADTFFVLSVLGARSVSLVR